MKGLYKELKYQFRYRLPMWLVGLLTNWWPDNHITVRLRGAMYRPFFKHCGQRFGLCKNVTFATPCDIEIGNDVYISYGVWINGFGGLKIKDRVKISPYVVIDTSAHVFVDNLVTSSSISSPITIGRGTWLASHVVVKSGVKIGDGVLVAGNAAVVKDVPDNVMVAGVPAKILGPRPQKDMSKVRHTRSFDSN